MKSKYDELWKIPEDTLSLASDYDITPENNDADISDMNYLSVNSSGKVNYAEIKYEIPKDAKQILDSNVEYGMYSISEADKVLKDNVKYISLRYICRNLNRTVEWVNDRDILHNLFYMIDRNGDRLYREDDVIGRCDFLHLEFRRMDLPFSIFNRIDAAEYLGMSQEEFESALHDIPSKEQYAEGGEHFSVYYKKDLDSYYRHHFFINMLAKSGATISYEDVCDVFGVRSIHLKEFLLTHAPQKMKTNDGYLTDRYSSESIREYMDAHPGDRSIYRPLGKIVSSDIARIYIMAERKEWLTARYEKKILKPVKTASGARIRTDRGFTMFLISDLDDYIYNRETGEAYGLGKEFIRRSHIKNRYGVNDKWIDTYVKNSSDVHIKVSPGNVMTWDTYHVSNRRDIITGIDAVDVEALIKNGHFIDITKEYVRKKLKIDQEENAKKYKIGKFAILAMHKKYVDSKRKSPYQYNEVTDDDISLALDTKINEERLIMQEKRRVLSKIRKESLQHDNKMRNILGLNPTSGTATSKKEILREMNSPQIFRCVYKRGKSNIYKRFNPPYETYDYISVVDHFFTRKSAISKTSLIMKAMKSGMMKMEDIAFTCYPGWFLFMDNYSCITDLMFKDRLNALPSDIGLVGAYGWKSITPDGDWRNLDDTYGCYDAFSSKSGISKKIIGKSGCGGTREVRIIGGPFIAIRASMVPDALRLKILDGYIAGDDHIGAVLSMFCYECRKKVCVIDASSMCCSDYLGYVGEDDWKDDQIEFVMRWQAQIKKISTAPAL